MPIHVSASALRDFIKCSNMVYYRIFEPMEQIQNKEQIMGTITHKVVEKKWNNLGDALTLAYKLCKEYKADAVTVNSVEHFINVFFENFAPMLKEDDKIEKFFKVKLIDDVFLVGKLDRIINGVGVIDWKTDANPKKRIDTDVQFIIYDMAFPLIYGRGAEGLYQASLKDGSLVRYSESPQHKDTLINHVIPEFINVVTKKNFIKEGLFNGSCYRCPYKVACLGGRNELDYPAIAEE